MPGSTCSPLVGLGARCRHDGRLLGSGHLGDRGPRALGARGKRPGGPRRLAGQAGLQDSRDGEGGGDVQGSGDRGNDGGGPGQTLASWCPAATQRMTTRVRSRTRPLAAVSGRLAVLEAGFSIAESMAP